jgi:hypothetical protein
MDNKREDEESTTFILFYISMQQSYVKYNRHAQFMYLCWTKQCVNHLVLYSLNF